jgi:hypothetical protein
MATLIPKFKQTGTGAVNRAINLKLAETVSVKDFDITLNKLRVGGATAWETITSA